jgi:hypothetical protein
LITHVRSSRQQVGAEYEINFRVRRHASWKRARGARSRANGVHVPFLSAAQPSHGRRPWGASPPRDGAWQLARDDALLLVVLMDFERRHSFLR